MSSKCPVKNVVFYVYERKFLMNECKFKEAYMKHKCGGEHMSAKEREQQINLQNFKSINCWLTVLTSDFTKPCCKLL